MEDEQLLLRQMPHSVEAEQAVLGSMLIDARCVPEVIDQLRSDDFYVRQNREIYDTIYSMFNYSLTIDPVTVLEHNPKGPGQKLLITGKGRCNVTSDSDVREFLPYVRHNGRFLYSSLYAFPPASAMQLFEELGRAAEDRARPPGLSPKRPRRRCAGGLAGLCPGCRICARQR